jgi:hypothetical protein
MTTGVRRRVFGDGRRIQALVLDHDGWAWTVIFTMSSLCWLALATLLLLTPG